MDNAIDRYVRLCYQEQNQLRTRYLVYHLGTHGFYAEFTTVVHAMIYAWQHNLRFALDSTGFGFRYRDGWSDYFEPIFEEYTPSLDPMVEMHSECTIRVMIY